VELIFLNAPAGATPEDQLLVQFQGMIAEYERAQIAERCRRGKKNMAKGRRERAFRRALRLSVCEEERLLGGFL
jgi:DNA invertase Pin-like site-specific DNA recombinase